MGSVQAKARGQHERQVSSALRDAHARVTPADYRLSAIPVIIELMREAIAIDDRQDDDTPREAYSHWASLAAAERRAATVATASTDDVIVFGVPMAPGVDRSKAVLEHYQSLVVDRNCVRDRDLHSWKVLCEFARNISAEKIALLHPKMIHNVEAETETPRAARTAARQVLRLKDYALACILQGVRHLLPAVERSRAAA